MKIAPIDIAHKTFTRKVMGLDADEVADFLRDIADQMEELVRERNALKESLRQKDLQVMEFRERDDALKATITTATKMSEQIRIDAEREAKLIVNDAQQKADLILRDSRDSLKRVYQEIADIKRIRLQFEVNMRALCQAHTSMLDQSHVTMPDPQINLAHAANATSPNMGGGHVVGGINGANAGVSGGGRQAPNTVAGFAVPQNGVAGMASNPVQGAGRGPGAPGTRP